MNTVLESPINKSLIVGGITFIISATVLNFTKPDFIMTIDQDTNEDVVDNFKLYIFCIMISVSVCIIVFLWSQKGVVIEYNNDHNPIHHVKLLKRESKSY